ncbi:2-dehydropantoate 2-reductase (Ketopantoate reductase) (KPA reductase) (KPR), partial [Spiromyces aspiralis]
EIRYLMARKLAVNAVINPITAILGCRNGELINSSDGRALISDLSREISLVFRSGSPELVHRGFSHADVEMAVLDTCRATALNRSSMLQDIVKGSRTEIDYISGYIAGLARKFAGSQWQHGQRFTFFTLTPLPMQGPGTDDPNADPPADSPKEIVEEDIKSVDAEKLLRQALPVPEPPEEGMCCG